MLETPYGATPLSRGGRARAARGFTGLLVATCCTLGTSTALAQGSGDLLVTPTRIVFEGRQRTAEITLVNVGSSTATYRITFVHLRMNEAGGMTEIGASGAEPGEQFADALIRYSPRQVTLEPTMAQTVRMQLRLPADLAPGEYRSHLLFRAVPPPEAAPKTIESVTDFTVRLTAIYGVSIPVIVRHGETSVTGTLSDLDLARPAGADPPALRFRIRRAGNQSIFGNLTATFVPSVGKPSVVGLAKGVAVYTPNPARRAELTLRAPPGVILENGRIHLAYTKQGKGNETIAEADLLVP
jgi:P pilus assembly chaperone PapD